MTDDAPSPLPPASKPSSWSVYVHLPFCDVRCPYCHFYCFVNRDEELPVRYVRALARELRIHRDAGRLTGPVESVYFGGGTPSALPAAARDALCTWLADELVPQAVEGGEVTVELNPESATPTTIAPWLAAGVNRLSVGIQSMDAATLQFLGRLNTPASNARALDLACDQASNVSVDLIAGTPGGEWSALRSSLEALVAWPITHVSAYLLEIHPDTPFGREAAAGRLRPAGDDDQASVYLAAGDWLEAHGLWAYELSNFARAGFESRHNQRYWRRLPYLGLGASAHSFHQERRWANHADALRYCADVEKGRLPWEFEETITAQARREERLLLGLRLREGVPLDQVDAPASLLRSYERSGLVRLTESRLAVTRAGWLVLDPMVSQLIR